MSKNQVQAATTLLRDHFGDIVSHVAFTLLSEGWVTLSAIIAKLKLPVGQVKQSIQLLLQHNFAIFNAPTKGPVEFSCDIHAVLLLARYPWYLRTAKSLYGNIGELIVEEMLTNGQLTASQCIRRVFALSQPLDLCKTAEEVKKIFTSLAETHFIIRCPNLDGETEVANPMSITPIFSPCKDPFLLPDKINVQTEGTTVQDTQSTKKRKAEPTDDQRDPDGDILWRVNFDKFHRYLRDQAILTTVQNTYQDKSADVFRSFLRLNELRSAPEALYSQPLSFNEAIKFLPDTANLVAAQIQQYTNCFAEDSSRMFKKVGESANGQFVIDFSNATKKLATICIEELVREKFGSKALRIFRLLNTNGYLEQSQLENLSMLPGKLAKDTTYRLISEGFVSIREVPKSTDFAPARTFYLCFVNLPQVAKKLIEICYKTINNLTLRRDYEIEQHKALLDRQERLESVVANIQADENMDEETKTQHVADVEEAYISMAEKEILAQHKKIVSKIQHAEIEADQFLFFLDMYIKHIPPFVTASNKRGKK